jgi:hypothetical protein
MGQRKKLERIDPAILEAVNGALARGATIDEVKLLIDGMGAEISRSALGEHAKQWREATRREREMQAFAKSMGAEFAEIGQDKKGQLLVQVAMTLASRLTLDTAQSDQVIDFKDMHFLARGIKDLMSAQKIDVERELKVREEVRRETTERAATEVDKAAKSGGMSAEVANALKAQIMGIGA